MDNKNSNLKKVMITVNGKPVGDGLLIDKITYVPVNTAGQAVKKSSMEMTRVSEG